MSVMVVKVQVAHEQWTMTLQNPIYAVFHKGKIVFLSLSLMIVFK